MIQKKRKKRKKQQDEKIPQSIVSPEPEAAKSAMIAATDEAFLGKYCNLAFFHHTELEFTFDFVYGLGVQNILASRMITSPQHAKRIYEALGANITQYEEKYGEIHISKKLKKAKKRMKHR